MMKLKIACLSVILFFFSYNLSSNANVIKTIHPTTLVVSTKKTYNVGLRNTDGSFRKFKSPQAGYNALVRDIEIKQSGNSSVIDSSSTIKELVEIYAPKFENNTKKYLSVLVDSLNIFNHTKINTINKHLLAKFILMQENRKIYNLLFKTKSICVSQTEN